MSAASWMIGHGVSSRSSHSWAAGRTTFSAKSWTHFWIWIWSSLRSNENSAMVSAPRVRRSCPSMLPAGNPVEPHSPEWDERRVSDPPAVGRWWR